METLGLKPNQEELDAMIREIDEDGNGEIDFDEFVQARARPPGELLGPSSLGPAKQRASGLPAPLNFPACR
jgi:hypothetical protein